MSRLNLLLALRCILFFFILHAICFVTSAQTLSADTDSLTWKASGFHNITKNEDVTAYSEFSSNSAKIIWSQNGGADINEFPVTSIQGSWTDVTQDGSILFNVTWNSLPGAIQIARAEGQVTITLIINKNGANITPFTFSINDVAKN